MNPLQNLSSIFSKKIFYIPDYQRGYAWTKEQRNDLIEDIEDILRLRRLKSDYMHFTGTIVAKKLPEKLSYSGESFDKYDIVDGQQRLTTLNIFLYELALIYESLGGDENEETSKNLRKNFIELRQGVHFRLNLNNSLNTFYTSNIIKEAGSHTTQQAENNLLEAKNDFKKYLGEKVKSNNESALNFLNELREVITDSLGFVWYEVADDHEVSVIFETMNSRGKQLTQFEKVKNILFYLAGRSATSKAESNALSSKINGIWSVVFTTLAGAPETDEDQFLRFFWAIFPSAEWFDEGKYENQNDRASDIHRGIKETAKKESFRNSPTDWINAFLSGIQEYVPIYRDIQCPKITGSFPFAIKKDRDEFIDLCGSIDRIGRDANLIPLLMAAYKQYQNTPNDLKEIFRLIEVFSFRLLLQGRYASTGRSKAFSLAAEISSGKFNNVKDVIEKIRNDLINVYCNDEQLKIRLSDKTINFYEWSGINYFLYEYEKHLSKENNLPLDWDKLLKIGKNKSIEHILPQGENTLSEGYWNKKFDPIQWKDNVNRLGNLVLADPRWNSSYGNKSFIDKQGKNSNPTDKVYKNSMSLSERELLEYDDWNVDSIGVREEKLFNFAVKRWKQ